MISFVIIGLNEEKNIARCIDSITYACENQIIDYEIIFVDSGSSDKTLDIVSKNYNVKIITVSGDFKSAALARHIGSEECNGDYIFFIDGDMEIEKDSNLKYCIDMLKTQGVGVISGKLKELRYKDNVVVDIVADRYNVLVDKVNLNTPGGYFLILKNVLQKGGGFNISIKCNEEIELFVRLKKLGYKIYRTNRLTCIHHDHKYYCKSSYIKKFKNNYYLDVITVMKIQLQQRTLKEYFSFEGQLTKWILVGWFAVMTMLFPISIIGGFIRLYVILFMLVLLIKYKLNIKHILKVSITSYLIIFSIFKLMKKKTVEYNYSLYKREKSN